MMSDTLRDRIRIQKSTFDVDAEIAALTAGDARAGAVASACRPRARHQRRLRRFRDMPGTLSRHDREGAGRDRCQARNRWALYATTVIHRVGDLYDRPHRAGCGFQVNTVAMPLPPANSSWITEDPGTVLEARGDARGARLSMHARVGRGFGGALGAGGIISAGLRSPRGKGVFRRSVGALHPALIFPPLAARCIQQWVGAAGHLAATAIRIDRGTMKTNGERSGVTQQPALPEDDDSFRYLANPETILVLLLDAAGVASSSARRCRRSPVATRPSR